MGIEEKFAVAFRAQNGAVHQLSGKAPSREETRYFVANGSLGSGITHNSAFANQRPAYFELRLHQNDPIRVGSQNVL